MAKKKQSKVSKVVTSARTESKNTVTRKLPERNVRGKKIEKTKLAETKKMNIRLNSIKNVLIPKKSEKTDKKKEDEPGRALRNRPMKHPVKSAPSSETSVRRSTVELRKHKLECVMCDVNVKKRKLNGTKELHLHDALSSTSMSNSAKKKNVAGGRRGQFRCSMCNISTPAKGATSKTMCKKCMSHSLKSFGLKECVVEVMDVNKLQSARRQTVKRQTVKRQTVKRHVSFSPQVTFFKTEKLRNTSKSTTKQTLTRNSRTKRVPARFNSATQKAPGNLQQKATKPNHTSKQKKQKAKEARPVRTVKPRSIKLKKLVPKKQAAKKPKEKKTETDKKVTKQRPKHTKLKKKSSRTVPLTQLSEPTPYVCAVCTVEFPNSLEGKNHELGHANRLPVLVLPRCEVPSPCREEELELITDQPGCSYTYKSSSHTQSKGFSSTNTMVVFPSDISNTLASLQTTTSDGSCPVVAPDSSTDSKVNSKVDTVKNKELKNPAKDKTPHREVEPVTKDSSNSVAEEGGAGVNNDPATKSTASTPKKSEAKETIDGTLSIVVKDSQEESTVAVNKADVNSHEQSSSPGMLQLPESKCDKVDSSLGMKPDESEATSERTADLSKEIAQTESAELDSQGLTEQLPTETESASVKMSQNENSELSSDKTVAPSAETVEPKVSEGADNLPEERTKCSDMGDVSSSSNETARDCETTSALNSVEDGEKGGLRINNSGSDLSTPTSQGKSENKETIDNTINGKEVNLNEDVSQNSSRNEHTSNSGEEALCEPSGGEDIPENTNKSSTTNLSSKGDGDHVSSSSMEDVNHNGHANENKSVDGVTIRHESGEGDHIKAGDSVVSRKMEITNQPKEHCHKDELASIPKECPIKNSDLES